MHSLLKCGLVAAGAVALAAPAIGQPEESIGGRKITATLSGAAEVPGPGDDNGAGLFEGRVNAGQGRICYTLSAGNIDKATVAQIHAGATGDPVLTLDTPDGDDDDSEDCQDIDAGLAQAMLANPGNYYVDIRTAANPRGAIRGTLKG